MQFPHQQQLINKLGQPPARIIFGPHKLICVAIEHPNTRPVTKVKRKYQQINNYPQQATTTRHDGHMDASQNICIPNTSTHVLRDAQLTTSSQSDCFACQRHSYKTLFQVDRLPGQTPSSRWPSHDHTRLDSVDSATANNNFVASRLSSS
jgi:hypothetical protein